MNGSSLFQFALNGVPLNYFAMAHNFGDCHDTTGRNGLSALKSVWIETKEAQL